MVWDSYGERLAVMFKGEITLFYNSYMFLGRWINTAYGLGQLRGKASCDVQR